MDISNPITFIAIIGLAGAAAYALWPRNQVIVRAPRTSAESQLHTAFQVAKQAGEVAGLQKLLAAHGEKEVQRTYAAAFGGGDAQPPKGQ